MVHEHAIAVSNLAWTPDRDDEALALVAARGATGVEVAPTRIAGWAALDDRSLNAYRAKLATHGLVVSSMQAILFGVDGAELLGGQAAFDVFSAHMRRVAAIGATLGAKVAVFGAPRSRLLNGLDREAAMVLAAERLERLAPAFLEAGVTLGIEPVPAHYGGEFLTHAADVAALVTRVAHPAVRLHLDTGCVHLGGDAIADAITSYAPHLTHFHVAEPDLAGFESPLPHHATAARALRAVGYGGWVAIEMKPQSPDPMLAIARALDFTLSVYDGAVGN